jgi:hypothetical protein
MAKSAIRYRKTGERFGLMVIAETGRCLAADISGIEGGCTWRHELVPVPQGAGAILKPLDGTSPTPASIALYGAVGVTYSCVKIAAYVQPFAPQQTGGAFNGQYVYTYEITWQQVGGVS